MPDPADKNNKPEVSRGRDPNENESVLRTTRLSFGRCYPQGVSTKEALHQLIDDLPEDQVDLVLRVLEDLRAGDPEDDEYTPEQRRAIDARLEHAGKGPYIGPFDSAEEMASAIEAEIKQRSGADKTPKRRK